MSGQINPATRPSRLSALGQLAVLLLLGASFASGVLVWWGQALQLRDGHSPAWLHPALVLHGALNPLLCVLFGVLVAHHIRLGWAMRANLLSGFTMEAVFLALILTGVGLYYAGDDTWRERLVWVHRVLGLLLPVTLGAHWIAGLRWGTRAVGPA